LEINTGVYCGQLSARVRDELWQRICDNIQDGRATMVYSAAGEQHLDFKIHNSDWQPIDYDGLKLIMHPLPSHRDQCVDSKEDLFISKAEAQKIAISGQKKKSVQAKNKDYTVIDIETTGLSIGEGQIIELAALRVRDEQIVERYSCLLNSCEKIPASISEITGITTGMIQRYGKQPAVALEEFVGFIGEDLLIGYHVNFDYTFIQQALNACGKDKLHNKQLDVLALARKKLEDVPNYKLSTICEHFGINISGRHRAMQDCLMVYEVYDKLNKI
jgi:CRISPR-associated protein Cas2